MNEATFEDTEHGKRAASDGWYALHVSEATWFHSDRFGTVCRLEGAVPFPDVGVNLRLVQPGQPACLYHRESAQEDFYVVSGECVLIIEEQERRLRAGHFVHCPAGATHVFVGAGDTPCVILAMGHRPAQHDLCYPVSEAAGKHGASVATETDSVEVAYGGAQRAPIPPVWPLP